MDSSNSSMLLFVHNKEKMIFFEYFYYSGRFGEWDVPLVYALSTHKSQDVYEMILTKLKELNSNINPTDFMMDFEMAALKACKNVFDMADIHGCIFHFGQNIWRHVQQLGLQTKYSEDDDFALNIRLLIALAYVPKENVIDAFEELMQTDFYQDNPDNEYNQEIQYLVAYFEATYIGAFNRTGQRKNPMFSIDIWNVYDAALMGKCQSNV